MRKILLCTFIFLCVTKCFAAKWHYKMLLVDDSRNVLVINSDGSITAKSKGATSNSIYTVGCSTNTARLVLSSNADRVGMIITNNSATYPCYMSTYSATAAELTTYLSYGSTTPATGFYKIVKDSEFSDSIEAYTGDVYVIGTSTTIQIGVMEKY